MKARWSRHLTAGQAAAAVLLLTAGCAPLAPAASGFASQHQVRFSQPAPAAAQCFARNAEAHSSALVSEVRTSGRGMQVVVSVKNGVTYAVADIEPAAGGAIGRVSLNVVSTAGADDLLMRLTEGC